MERPIDRANRQAKKPEGIGYHSSEKHFKLNPNRKTEAFKKGRTSGNYATHEESDKKEKEYRAIAKARALNNAKK